MKQSYQIKAGQTLWFEYRCWESHDSADAHLWYRSHQRVKVIRRETPGCGANEEERAENGHPAAFKVRFKDGFVGTAMEDELVERRRDFTRDNPPKVQPKKLLPQTPKTSNRKPKGHT